MIDTLVVRLRESRPPEDLRREALARLPGDLAARLFSGPPVPAAVLVGLMPRASGWDVLLTRRTEQMRDHPGQISFPGGRLEPQDEGPRDAAVREAREEVGIEPEFIEVVGYLPPHAVVTGFVVSPVVALLRPGFTLQADPVEVAEILSVPLDFLLDPANLVTGERTVRGVTLPLYTWQFGRHRIWGATAQILHALREVIHAANQ